MGEPYRTCEGNIADEMMGKFDFQKKNAEEQMVVNFAKRKEEGRV